MPPTCPICAATLDTDLHEGPYCFICESAGNAAAERKLLKQTNEKSKAIDRLAAIERDLAAVKKRKAKLEMELMESGDLPLPEEPEPMSTPTTPTTPPPKTDAASRVIATLAKDPALLAAVREQLGVETAPTMPGDGLGANPQQVDDPLTKAIDLLKEGRAAFETFCQANNVIRNVFGSSNTQAQNKSPKADAWRAYMKTDAIPRNAEIAYYLGQVFGGSATPPPVREFLNYTEDYTNLMAKWMSKDDGVPHTIGRNFPAGFDLYLESVRAARNAANATGLDLGVHTAWAVLLVENGQQDAGWTLLPNRTIADDYRVRRNEDARSRATPEQYFTYKRPQPVEVDAAVWKKLTALGQLTSKFDRLNRNVVVTSGMVV